MNEINKKDLAQSQQRWDREEQVLLVVEFFNSKYDELSVAKSDVFLSSFLRKRAQMLGYEIGDKYRNEWGVHSQRENLSHFDPEGKCKITGHESVWMEKIVKEYLNDSEKIILEAYDVLKKYI